MKAFIATGAARTLLTAAGVSFFSIGLSGDARAAVPEIDAGSLPSGLALLTGLALLITARRPKRVDPSDRD